MSDYQHRSGSRRYGDQEERSRGDDPPNSRLFIIGGKTITEAEFRDAFSEYGKIESLDIKKDRTTGAPKGITYVKFSKTSEAAAALENLNGKCLGDDPRPLKIVIASSRGEASGRGAGGEDDDVKATRLFLVVPKKMTEEEIREVFSEYGPIEHITIVRDKLSGNPRGLAYVRYHRFSHAAKAFENCDPSYRPKFAEPKPQPGIGGLRMAPSSDRGGGMMTGNFGGFGGAASFGGGGFTGPMGGGGGNFMGGGGRDVMPQNNMAAVFGMMQQSSSSVQNPTNSCRLRVLFNPSMSKDMFWNLFNIVPGLEHCELIEMTADGAWGGVIYNNPRSAAWAIERIHGFEYPPGFKIIVTYDDMAPRSGGAFSMANGMPGMGGQMTANGGNVSGDNVGGGGGNKPLPSNIMSLVSSIQAATEALKASGYGGVISGGGSGSAPAGGSGMSATGMGFGGGYETDAQAVCSAKLPARQPTLPATTRVEERLFFVLKDALEPPAPAMVTDLFCRFGNLIDAYCLPRKKCGYARYAKKESADEAVALLNDQDLLNSRLKVVLADEEKPGKRPRLD